MSKVLGFCLLLTIAFQMNRSTADRVEIGGAATGVPCDVRTGPTPCTGSYVGSTGCGVNTVLNSTAGHLIEKLSATPTGNCNTVLDSANVACRANANQNILPGYACTKSWF